MFSLNEVKIIGNITGDIELKQTPSGNNVCSFGVATNRQWTDSAGVKQEKAEFHNVVLWGKLAEIANEYAGKGKQVYISGRLETRSWEAQDGSKRYRTEIIGESMILLGGSKNDTTSKIPYTNDYSKKAPKKQEEEINIEDIPF